jgi:hypothetical protein
VPSPETDDAAFSPHTRKLSIAVKTIIQDVGLFRSFVCVCRDRHGSGSYWLQEVYLTLKEDAKLTMVLKTAAAGNITQASAQCHQKSWGTAILTLLKSS